MCLLCSGVNGVPIEIVARAAFEAVTYFDQSINGPTSRRIRYLTDIHFVNIDEVATQNFQQVFNVDPVLRTTVPVAHQNNSSDVDQTPVGYASGAASRTGRNRMRIVESDNTRAKPHPNSSTDVDHTSVGYANGDANGRGRTGKRLVKVGSTKARQHQDLQWVSSDVHDSHVPTSVKQQKTQVSIPVLKQTIQTTVVIGTHEQNAWFV